MAFLNLFAAYSTTSDKRKVLQMADAFSYNVRGFKATWRDLMELFKILHHTAMTTASHLYIHHRSEQWSDTKKINFAIDMFIKADQQWVLEALTRPGAETYHHDSCGGRVFEHPCARRGASWRRWRRA